MEDSTNVSRETSVRRLYSGIVLPKQLLHIHLAEIVNAQGNKNQTDNHQKTKCSCQKTIFPFQTPGVTGDCAINSRHLGQNTWSS